MSTRNGNGRTTPKQTRPTKTVELVELPPPVPTEPAAAVAPPAGKLCLLKVALQPVLVLVADDGTVREVQHPAIEVKGVDWAEWSQAAFTDEALAAMKDSIGPA